jgi:hypothetical protein
MSVFEIEEKVMCLSGEEKLGLIERLWKSMETAPDDEPPAWHGDVLAERLAKIESGDATFISSKDFLARMEARSREARLSQ